MYVMNEQDFKYYIWWKYSDAVYRSPDNSITISGASVRNRDRITEKLLSNILMFNRMSKKDKIYIDYVLYNYRAYFKKKKTNKITKKYLSLCKLYKEGWDI